MLRPLVAVIAMLAVFPAVARTTSAAGWTVEASLDEEGNFAACLASRGEGPGGYLGLGVNAEAQPLVIVSAPQLHLRHDEALDVTFHFGSGQGVTTQARATDTRTIVFPVSDAAIAAFATSGTLTVKVRDRSVARSLAGSGTAIRALGDCVAAAGAVRPARF